MTPVSAWRRSRILRDQRITAQAWASHAVSLPLLRNLTAEDLEKLRDLTTLFLHEKQFQGRYGLDVTSEMRILVAAQACLLILNLGLDYYRGWTSIILLPEEYSAEHSYEDEWGIVHETESTLSGEAWDAGPVVLSLDTAVEESLDPKGPYNLIVHEFAHKLDMLNGRANGMPPLGADMDQGAWTRTFQAAYADHRERVSQPAGPHLHPDADESPAEFFAVASEAFFTSPVQLAACYPEVYHQLSGFYRQDPLLRAS